MSWQGELVAVWAFALRNLLMASRNVFFAFELVFWPVVGVLSIGLLSRFLTLGADDAAFILTGTIALSTVQVCQLDVAYAVLFDVWSKSMKHQFLAPIGVRHLTTGSWLIGVVRGLIVFTILTVLARTAFGFDALQGGPGPLAVFLLGCFLMAWIIGVAVGALVMLFGTRAEATAWASANFVLLLAGIYYPISILPGAVGFLSAAVPLTYFLDAYRSHFGFPSMSAAPVRIGLTLSVLYLLLSHWGFVLAVRRTRRTGLLLRMSE
ncbi:MAG: ABC transporter permease [Candidatus Rokuibacteriota bacterium]